MKIFLALLALSLFHYSVNAQNNSLSGLVTDKTAVGLPGAAVQLLNPVDSTFIKGTVSDVNGNFTIDDIKSGQYLISVSPKTANFYKTGYIKIRFPNFLLIFCVIC